METDRSGGGGSALPRTLAPLGDPLTHSRGGVVPGPDGQRPTEIANRRVRGYGGNGMAVGHIDDDDDDDDGDDDTAEEDDSFLRLEEEADGQGEEGEEEEERRRRQAGGGLELTGDDGYGAGGAAAAGLSPSDRTRSSSAYDACGINRPF